MSTSNNSSKKLEEKSRWPWLNAVDPAEYDMQINWPKISLVTPSYNQGQYIEETILSIIHQNYPNLEYIIIDGGSTDNTVEVIKKYEQHITYWVSEPDAGQSDAINKGIAQCTGDIFNWVNSDDYLQPLALKKVALYFLHHDLHVLGGKRRRFYNEKEVLPIHPTHDSLTLLKDAEEAIVYNPFIQLPTFFSLPIIKQLGGVNPQLHYVMDSELWIRFLLKFGQDKVLLVEDWLGNYRLHERSKTVHLQQKFKEELNQVYFMLFSQLGISKKVIYRMTKRKATSFELCYELNQISKNKLKWYIYIKALRWYIGFPEPVFFVRTLVKAMQLYPFEGGKFKCIFNTLFWPRLVARLPHKR